MAESHSYIGTSGFTLQNFYSPQLVPQHKLTVYAEVFETVEINSSFYHLPRKSTIEKWRVSVPSNFVFAFKVFQAITHAENKTINMALLEKWFELYRPFEASLKKQIMLFQFPQSFVLNLEQLAKLVAHLSKAFRYAFEFRHPSWFMPAIYELVKAHEATIVYSDAPVTPAGQPLWPKYDLLAAPFSYLRFHGSSKLYSSSYSAAEIKNFALMIKDKTLNGKDVFTYFNNDAQGYAAANAQTLITELNQL
jgi:uncharacterized protein YecE (DUF72 family)